MTGRPEYWGRLDIVNQSAEVRRIWFSRNDELPELPVVDDLPQEPDTLDLVASKDLLKKIIEKTPLKPKEKIFITIRFMHEYTLDEMALCFRLTRERCRQIEKTAIRKLRAIAKQEFGLEVYEWGEVTTWKGWRRATAQRVEEEQQRAKRIEEYYAKYHRLQEQPKPS